MSLSTAFKNSAPFTQQDVDNLVAALDANPTNADKMFTFGKSLYGMVPFPARLFMAAQNEMMARYDLVHIAQAESDAYFAEAGISSYSDRDGKFVRQGEKYAQDARAKLDEMQHAKRRFGEIADSNAAMMAHVASEAQKAEWERLERQELLARQAAEAERQQADAERQHVQAMVNAKNRIIAVTVQTGKLNQPVTAPKVAKFKARLAIPSR